MLPPVIEKERMVRNSQLLIRLAKILDLPVLLSTQYSKGLGPTVPEIASLLPEVAPLEKNEFGCFNNDAYCARVKALPDDRNTLLVCGLESHIGVTQTVLGALNSVYIVHVASDAVSSRTEWNRKIGLERMHTAGAVISSTEMMIYELLRTSSGPAFKEMKKAREAAGLAA
jgi:isochorismate hydrolase